MSSSELPPIPSIPAIPGPVGLGPLKSVDEQLRILHERQQGPTNDRYHLIIYQAKDLVTAGVVQQYNVSGDTLTIDRVRGQEPVWVRVGDPANPWIRVERGLVIKRAFEKVWFRSTVVDNLPLGIVTQVWAYASFGDLVQRWVPIHGAGSPGPFCIEGQATTAPQSVLEPLFTAFARRASALRISGDFIITNADLGTTLYLQIGGLGGVPGTFRYPLLPGQTIGFAMDDSVQVIFEGGGSVYAEWGLLVFTLTGSAVYNVMVGNVSFDASEPFRDGRRIIAPQG